MIQKNRHWKIWLVSLLACSGFVSTGQNIWPQFRGPENNMVAKSAHLPETWGTNLNVKWTFDMPGESYSSPIVSGDKIFITSVFAEKRKEPVAPPPLPPPPPPPPPPTQPNATNPAAATKPAPPQPPPVDNSYLEEIYRWEVTCLDLKTGKELWKQVARKGSPKGRKHAASNYACETPVTDGKRVYAYFGMNGLFCYDLNGKLLWQKEIEAKETQKNWGTGSSPVIYNNILYVLNDNEEDSWIMALDAATGNEKWKVKRQEPTTYGTPVIWKNNARTELVTMGKTARSYDPATGNLLWELKIGGEQAIASPVYDKENIYLGNSGGREIITDLFCVKAGAAGDITPADSGLVSSGVKWTVRKANVNNPSPLLYDGLIYIVAGRGGDLSCFEAATGSLVYKTKVPKVGACWATPWIQNGKLYFFDEKGITQVVKTGKIFESIATNTLDDKFWASVAITDKAYIFKGVKKIWCVGGTE